MSVVITDWSELPVMVPLRLAATTIGISRSTLYKLLEEGALRARHVGGRRFVAKVELQRFCEGGERDAVSA